MSRDTTTPDDAAAFEAAATTSGTATSAGETIPGDLLPLCREHICPVCPEKAQADEQRLRALADLENTKKRLQREKDEQVRYAAETVLADLLPTLDNLDLGWFGVPLADFLFAGIQFSLLRAGWPEPPKPATRG